MTVRKQILLPQCSVTADPRNTTPTKYVNRTNVDNRYQFKHKNWQQFLSFSFPHPTPRVQVDLLLIIITGWLIIDLNYFLFLLWLALLYYIYIYNIIFAVLGWDSIPFSNIIICNFVSDSWEHFMPTFVLLKRCAWRKYMPHFEIS